jgi:hypothetical protein
MRFMIQAPMQHYTFRSLLICTQPLLRRKNDLSAAFAVVFLPGISCSNREKGGHPNRVSAFRLSNKTAVNNLR